MNTIIIFTQISICTLNIGKILNLWKYHHSPLQKISFKKLQWIMNNYTALVSTFNAQRLFKSKWFLKTRFEVFLGVLKIWFICRMEKLFCGEFLKTEMTPFQYYPQLLPYGYYNHKGQIIEIEMYSLNFLLTRTKEPHKLQT